MHYFFRLITKKALIALAILAAITLFFAFHLGKLHIDTSIKQMLVEDLPATKQYDRYKSEFGWASGDILVVFKAEDVFSPAAFKKIGRLTDDLKSLRGIRRVVSLDTLKYDLDFLNEWTLEDLKRNVSLADIFANHVVSTDGKTTAIVVVLKEDCQINSTAEAIESILEKHRDSNKPFQLYQIGAPVIGYTLTKYTEKNLKTLPIFAGLIMFIVLLLCFRSLRGALVPLTSVSISLIWTFGLMGLVGASLSMVTMIIPVLLIAVGTAYALHIMAAYNDETRRRPEHKEAIVAGLVRICLPTVLTSATTIVGFASLILNEIQVTKEFAIFSCLGLLFMLAIHLTFIPAVLSLLKKPNLTKVSSPGKPFLIESFLVKVLRITIDHPKAVIVFSSLIALVAAAGIFRIKVETTPINYFKEKAPLRIAFKDVYKNLSGIYPVNVVLRSKKPGYFKSPNVLRQIEAFQNFVVGIDGVDIATSVVDLIKFEELLTRNFRDKAKYYVLPADPFIIQEAVKNCRMLDGDTAINYFVSKDFSKINITCRTHLTSTADFIKLEQVILNYLQDHLPKEVHYDVTGLTMAISHSSKAVTVGQIESLGLALVFVFVLFSILFVSPRVGFYAMLPNFFPILVNFGVMGWFGIDLCVATSLIASIAIGLAVDDTIHYAFRFNHEFKKNIGREEALARVTIRVGKPIVFTSLAIGLGFSVLFCSSFVPTIIFGFLMLTTVTSALFGDLVILPMILYRINLVTLWDFVSQVSGRDLYRKVALIAGILRSQAGSVVITGPEKNFKDQEVIFQEGEPGNTMYLILRGKVMVECDNGDGKQTATELAEGEVFTEPKATYCQGGNGTAVALEKTRLFQIDKRYFKRLKKLSSKTSPGFVHLSLEGIQAKRQETARGAVNCRHIANRAKLYSCWLQDS